MKAVTVFMRWLLLLNLLDFLTHIFSDEYILFSRKFYEIQSLHYLTGTQKICFIVTSLETKNDLSYEVSSLENLHKILPVVLCVEMFSSLLNLDTYSMLAYFSGRHKENKQEHSSLLSGSQDKHLHMINYHQPHLLYIN